MNDDDIDATLRRLGAAWRSRTPDSAALGPFDQTVDVRPVVQPARRTRRAFTPLVATGLAVAAWVVVSVLVGHLRPGPTDGADPVVAPSASVAPSATSPSTATSPSAATSPSTATSPSVASPPPSSPSPSSAPPCTADQLTASVGPHGPAAGTENILIVLTNTSGAACTLGGKVELTGVHPDGTVDNPGFASYTDPAYAPPSPAGSRGPVAPGEAGGFVLAEGLSCAPIKGDYDTLRIKIAHGPTIDMPWDRMFSGCSPYVGPAGPLPHVDEDSTLESLMAEAQAG